MVLLTTSFLAVFADLILVVIIGPLVVVSMLALALDLTEELPPFLRITGRRRSRVIAGGLIALLLFMTVLSTEVVIVGPDLRTHGVHGFIAPRVLGFSAQPMLAIDVDGAREPHEVLYLGGNADLDVLVNPCNDDVQYVSVGATRLEVIDEVGC